MIFTAIQAFTTLGSTGNSSRLPRVLPVPRVWLMSSQSLPFFPEVLYLYSYMSIPPLSKAKPDCSLSDVACHYYRLPGCPTRAHCQEDEICPIPVPVLVQCHPTEMLQQLETEVFLASTRRIHSKKDESQTVENAFHVSSRKKHLRRNLQPGARAESRGEGGDRCQWNQWSQPRRRDSGHPVPTATVSLTLSCRSPCQLGSFTQLVHQHLPCMA